MSRSDVTVLNSISRERGCSHLKVPQMALETFVNNYTASHFIPPDDLIRLYCLRTLMGHDVVNPQELAALIDHYLRRQRGTERLIATAWGREIAENDWRIEDEEVRLQHRANYNALCLTRNLLEDGLHPTLAVEIFSMFEQGCWMGDGKRPLFSKWVPRSDNGRLDGNA